MRKAIFYLAIIASIFFVYNIFQILGLGLNRLSNYGLGALCGKILLLLLAVAVVYKTRPKND